MADLAFLGLGVMGWPMAGHLATAGHAVTVWNRTGSKALDWAKTHKGSAAGSIKDAVADKDAVFVCVGEDADVRAVTTPAMEAMKAGAVLVDHTTASAALARDLAEHCKDCGARFLDAPVSGGQSGAEAGQLTIMCGGDEGTFDDAKHWMAPYAKAITLMGPAGAGQLTKMVNQICIAGVVQGLAEGVHFAEAAGLDVAKVFAAIGQGAAQSWQMDNRAATMAKGEFDFGFAVDWMRKDLAMTMAEARRNGAQIPLAALVDQFYADVQALGGGRWDTSSLVARLKIRPKDR